MAEIVPRRNRTFGFLPDLHDLFEPPGWLWGDGGPLAARSIRVEARFDDDAYVVRAELPGLDPAKDIEVKVDGDLLTLSAERTEEKTDKQHSEFRYGSFSRTVQLPAGARSDEVTASYDAGILTVRVPVSKPVASSARTIEVTPGSSEK